MKFLTKMLEDLQMLEEEAAFRSDFKVLLAVIPILSKSD